MPRLTVPSVQHLARNWRRDPRRITRTLVGLARRPPTFSYGKLTVAARDLLAFHQPFEEVVRGLERTIKRTEVLTNFLEVLPLLDGHFKSFTPHAVLTIDPQIYRVGKGLRIPFHPPFLYEMDGQLHLPWLSFWRSNPLAGLNLSLFATMIDDILRTTPALRGAKVSILDFSRPNSKMPRQLNVIHFDEVPRVPTEEKLEMLAIFAEAFFMAQQELSSEAPEADKKKDSRRPRDEEKGDDLFR